MTLTYRGVSYRTFNLTVNTQKTRFKATYRGQSYQLSDSFDFISKPARNLTYRGVKYNNSLIHALPPTIQHLEPVFS